MWILISVLNEPPSVVLNGPVHFFSKHLLRFGLLFTKTKYCNFSLHASCANVTDKFYLKKLIINSVLGL